MQRRGRDIARSPTTPKRALSAARIETTQRGPSTQRARAVSASVEKVMARSMGAEVRHAGCEARADAFSSMDISSVLGAYSGKTGPSVSLTHQRIIIYLCAYYSDDNFARALRSSISVDSVARRCVDAFMSDLSPKSATEVLACWEQTGKLAPEVPCTRWASVAAYSRWNRLPADAEVAVTH